ncbi:mechanosensitive ion channel family protein [Candidatus Macondimonas diazotrophica]|jgi:small-conductance mechanosensitive channel|uniref:Mechanosensitive ion channel family protein n=1 Tax=Candidatus Macondimonas diazotrophica TaxID=2305248 RepID=A0A4Z0FEC1_9GAMM|nr:mechanosensitive ion channel family protein [Candidatus Macondimonas diazotrophica]NCU00472.1 mechanosensitive ion channel family protein [Candidatus Macondimonas diazotrophica]TFZ84062.1 mechanosensitive ion channel family protein [Candidatus Macondimonas diazotrophica]HBG51369.1 mechanosensitive ion channel protein MscS [Gammaproteobacteria bacterium]
MTWNEINWAELGPLGWLELVILGNELRAWLIALGLTLIVMAALPAIKAQIKRRLQARAAQQDAVISRYAVEIVGGTRRSIMLLVAIFVGARALVLPAKIDATLTTLTAVALLLQTTLWALEAFDVWVTRYEQRARARDAGDATIVGLISFVGRTAICAIAVLMILDNLGFNITTLVASLGIGGIAIALAVQNVLADLFASLSIGLDKPFVVGDFIIVGDMMGTVEHVGLKTTRLRSLSGEQLVFSNTDLLQSRIRNYKRMYERRIVFKFGVLYDTPRDALGRLPGIVREIIESQDGVRFDRAHFFSFGDSSLDFEVVYYVLDPDYTHYMDIQQAINLAMIDRFAELGVEFAFPTRTLHIESMPGAAPAAQKPTSS